MFYISSEKKNGKYGITDSEDGVEEVYSAREIINMVRAGVPINGVTAQGITVCNVHQEVTQKTFDMFGNVVKQKVATYSEEMCYDLARSVHFVKKLKGLSDINDIRQVTYENIYPDSIREVVKSAEAYTNSIHEIDARNVEAVKNALRNNVCLVLQHKTNGALTAFICTGNINIMDNIYMPTFIDAWYLTKQLYGITVNVDKVRKEVERESKPNLLNVFSCSLRFRSKANSKDTRAEMSSPFYSVNTDKILAMFVLDNPKALGVGMMKKFVLDKQKGIKDPTYAFDFDIFDAAMKCIEDRTNYFKDKDTWLKFVDLNTITKAVDVNYVLERFNSNFEYMSYLRNNTYSFK